jgi:hypothetical protein
MNRGEFLSAAFLTGCETCIEDVARVFSIQLDEHPFETCLAVQNVLLEHGLTLTPPLPKGDLKSPRLIAGAPTKICVDDVLREIAEGESALLEFKSTLFFDVRKSRANPGASRDELKSEEVLHSSLKTIAAFLNSDGGVLLVGVQDDGSFYGIEEDFHYCGDRSTDSWELTLRDLIQARFHDGRSVNSFVRTAHVTSEGKCIVRVTVTKRSNLSYLKGKGADYDLYIRQGNRTVKLSLPEAEELWLTRASRI